MHAFHRECAFEFAKLQKIICVCKLICENYKGNPQVLKSRVYVEVYDRYMLGTCLQTYTSPETPIYKGFHECQGICWPDFDGF
jgi:hypothetical protein